MPEDKKVENLIINKLTKEQYKNIEIKSEYELYDIIDEEHYTSEEINTLLERKQDKLTAGENISIEENVISATYTAGEGINISNGVITNTQTSAEWGNIKGDVNTQQDLQQILNTKVDKEDGKSLIADTEIERLVNVTNYDDTAIKDDISSINTDIVNINNDLDSLEDRLSLKQNSLIAGNNVVLTPEGDFTKIDVANPAVLADNETIIKDENNIITTVGIKSKNDVITYDWIGTTEQYNIDLASGLISDTTKCFITDDETDLTGVIDINVPTKVSDLANDANFVNQASLDSVKDNLQKQIDSGFDDSNLVHKTNNEIIGGFKQFKEEISISNTIDTAKLSHKNTLVSSLDDSYIQFGPQELIYNNGTSNDIYHTGNLIAGDNVVITQEDEIYKIGFNKDELATYTKDEIDEYLNLKQNKLTASEYISISNNVISTKNVVNYSNITNCVIEYPQRIKLELNNGTLTLKAGSVVTVPYGTTDRSNDFPIGSTFLNSNFKVIDRQFTSGKFFVWAELQSDKVGKTQISDTYQRFMAVTITDGIMNSEVYTYSGAEITPTSVGFWYDTTNNIVTRYGSAYAGKTYSFPICMVTADGTYLAASLDQVFNGIGYIGSTVWVDKGVKYLVPNGRNEDGSLNNIEVTTSKISTKTNSTAYPYNFRLYLSSAGGLNWEIAEHVLDSKQTPTTTQWWFYYDKETNYWKGSNDLGVTWTNWAGMYIPTIISVDSSTKITGVKNPMTVFRAVDYNEFKQKADKSEVLNKSQITNCLTEIPQRLNVTVADGTITLKAGSVVIVPYGTTDRSSEFSVGSQFLNSNWKVVDTQFADNKFFVWAELQNDISRQRTETPDGNDRFISIYMDGGINGAVSAVSGTTFSNQIGYNTSTNEVHWYNADGTYLATYMPFPIGIVACSDTYTFGSIKQVFNGMGYIGRTLWLNKGVKILIGTDRNADGTIKNAEITTKLLLKQSHNYTEDRLLFYKKSGTLEDLRPDTYLTGLKKDMPTTVSGTVLYNYFCTDTLETYWTADSTTTNWQQAEYKTRIAVYGAIKEADGKTITFLNPYQAFSAVDYNEYKSAIDSKISKSGDTMTGQLVVNTTDGSPIVIKGMGGVDVTVNPSSTRYYGIQLEDVNGVRMGRLEGIFNTNGTIETSITANKTVNGTVKYANFRVGVDANGNATYSHPQITATYTNGTSWYRVWSNNWCEQGGYFTALSTAQNKVCTFLKPFKDTNYNVTTTVYQTKDKDAYAYWMGTVYAYSTTSITVKLDTNVYYDGVWWRAEGYIS